MPLDSDEATDIALDAGLTMSDAAALRMLTDDPDHARTIAAKFSPQPDPDQIADKILGGGR